MQAIVGAKRQRSRVAIVLSAARRVGPLLVVLILLGCLAPSAVARPLLNRSQGHGIQPYSTHPRGEEPMHACPPATAHRVTCAAVVQPLGESEQPIGRTRNQASPGTLSSACFTGVFPFCGSGANHGLSPQDLQSAYRLKTANGSGQTVAVVDAFDDPNAEEDLAVYRATYGLPACTTANGCFKKVDQRGGSEFPEAEPGWAMEISLDLDMVSAACPNCHIILVEGDNAGVAALGEAENTAAKLGATEISNSYGLAEGFLSEGSLFNSISGYYNHPGTAMFAASGDWYYDNEELFTEYGCFTIEDCAAAWPASLQTILSVGGTNLTPEGTSGRGWKEEVWNGSGGGCAKFVAKPSWQTDSGCSRRTDSDIGGIADPATPVSVYNTYVVNYRVPGWHLIGGTSASAPLAAGAFALESEARRSEGAAGIYGHPSEWNDVVGGTDWLYKACSSSYLCTGVSGYDGPTGLGSPNGGASTTAPAAITESASAVTTTTATLNATVNPEATSATYYFEYGTSTSYGSKAPTTPASIAGYTQPQPVSQALSGLSTSTRYHYRIVAESAGGKTIGADRTFSTLPRVHRANIGSVGSTEGHFNSPSDSAIDQNGNIWVTDTNNSRVELFTPQGKFIKSCGQFGTEFKEGSLAQLNHPTGIAIDRVLHYLYVADTGNNRILIIHPEDCKTFRKLGQPYTKEEEYPEEAELLEPQGLSFASDNGGEELLVADTGHDRIVAFDYLFSEGLFLGAYGASGSGNGQFNDPTDIAPAGDPGFYTHEFLVVDSGNNRVQRIEEEQVHEEEGAITEDQFSFVSKFGEAGTGNGQFSKPVGIAFDSTTNEFSISDSKNGRVEQFLPNGTYAGQFGSAGFGGESLLASPKGLSISENGTVYVADSENNRLSPWAPAGTTVPPSATTLTATSITATGATLRGGVNPQGSATTYRFQYGTTENYGTTVPFPGESAGSGSSEVTETKAITGLHGGATYHYRIVATNEGGTTYGADTTFATSSVAPSAKTLYPRIETKKRYAVNLEALVNPRGATTQAYFEYGASKTEPESYGHKTAVKEIASGTSNVEVVELEVPLEPVTEYHYRVVATNSHGTTYGQDVSFKNSSRGTTEATTEIGPSYATFNATVDPEGQKTYYQFEYSPDTSYSLKAPEPHAVAGSGESYVHVSQKVTGLRPNTTYHVRIGTEEQARLFPKFGLPVEFTTPPSVAFCKNNENPCPKANRYGTGTKVSAALKTGTAFTLKGAGGETINSCSGSSLEGSVTGAGGSGEAASIDVSTASFKECSSAITPESLSWHSEITRPEGSSSGTETFSNLRMQMTIFGVSCVYGGKVAFALKGGTQAELIAEGASIGKISGGFLCPSTLSLTATYVLSAPAPLYLTAFPLGNTVLCGTASEVCAEANRYAAGTKLSASLKSGTSLTLKTTSGELMDSCSGSSLEGSVTGAGGSGEAASADVSSASFSSCTSTLTAEGLSWHSQFLVAEGSTPGSETFSNVSLKVAIFGVNCTYAGSLGFTLTGGAEAELAAKEASLAKTVGGFLCPSTLLLTASYGVKSPVPLYLSRAS